MARRAAMDVRETTRRSTLDRALRIGALPRGLGGDPRARLARRRRDDRADRTELLSRRKGQRRLAQRSDRRLRRDADRRARQFRGDAADVAAHEKLCREPPFGEHRPRTGEPAPDARAQPALLGARNPQGEAPDRSAHLGRAAKSERLETKRPASVETGRRVLLSACLAVRLSRLEALAAIDRFVTARLEGDFRRAAALAANRLVHLALTASATVTAAAATAAVGRAASRGGALGLTGRPTIGATVGLVLETFGGKKLLLAGAERKLRVAVRTGQTFISVHA